MMTFSFSLMVTDSALELEYASVISSILEFKSMKQHHDVSYYICCVPYMRSLVVHISARLWLNAHKTR